MGTHSISLSEDVEYIWGKHFSKGKWGYQNFSDFISKKIEELERENMLDEELQHEINKLIAEKGDIDFEIEKIQRWIKERKEKEKQEKQEKERFFNTVNSTIEINYLANLSSLINKQEKKELIINHKEDYLNKFNKEGKITNDSFLELINLAIAKKREFILK